MPSVKLPEFLSYPLIDSSWNTLPHPVLTFFVKLQETGSTETVTGKGWFGSL